MRLHVHALVVARVLVAHALRRLAVRLVRALVAAAAAVERVVRGERVVVAVRAEAAAALFVRAAVGAVAPRLDEPFVEVGDAWAGVLVEGLPPWDLVADAVHAGAEVVVAVFFAPVFTVVWRRGLLAGGVRSEDMANEGGLTVAEIVGVATRGELVVRDEVAADTSGAAAVRLGVAPALCFCERLRDEFRGVVGAAWRLAFIVVAALGVHLVPAPPGLCVVGDCRLDLLWIDLDRGSSRKENDLAMPGADSRLGEVTVQCPHIVGGWGAHCHTTIAFDGEHSSFVPVHVVAIRAGVDQDHGAVVFTCGVLVAVGPFKD